MRRALLFLVVACCFAFSEASAQEKTVTGRVTSTEDGSGLPGVNVVLKNTTKGTTTDVNGRFSLSVPESGGILVFSFIGLQTQEVEVGARSTVDVSLASDTQQLTEVVVVGYGTQARRDLNGSISSVSGADIAIAPVQSFDQALQGRAAGVNITTPNGVLNNPPVIRIRGVNSLNLSSQPLIVIDGVPTYSGDLSSNSAANNPLGNINPSDIASMEILKDASASAIYGSRASAGVILITTKRGSSGKARVNLDSWVGWTEPFNLFEVLDANQYIEVKNEARRNAGLADAFFPTNDANGNLINTNWADLIYRTGFSHSNALSVSGGTEATKYFFSTGFTQQEGMFVNNDFERLTTRFNVDHALTKKVNIGMTAAYTNAINRAPNTGSLAGTAFNTSGAARLAFVTAPNVAPRLANGAYNLEGNFIGRMNNTVQSGFVNPAPIMDLNTFSSVNNQIQGSVYLSVQPIKGLTLKTLYGIDRLTIEDETWNTALHGDGFTDGGIATNYNRTLNRWNWQNTAQYDFSLDDKHNFSLLVGGEQQYTVQKRWGVTRFGVTDQFFTSIQGNFTNIRNPGNLINSENYLISYFGRFNYDFNKKYSINFTARRDGYSAFAEGKKYGNFYGGAVGYTISEESFYANSGLASTLNFLKLRASYGTVGNFNGIDDFAALQTYGSGLYGALGTLVFNQAGNVDLSWETSTKIDVGLQFGLLQDKIQGEVGYYINEINDLILNVPQARSKGIPNNELAANVGSMENRGIELSIKYNAIRTQNFQWTVSGNFTTLKNEVTALDRPDSEIRTSTGGLEVTNITKVGEPVASLIAVRTAGINPENGRRIFVRKDGTLVQFDFGDPVSANRWRLMDGTVTTPVNLQADGVVFGPTMPTWYGGFDNNFKYKNFDLGIFFQFSGGNLIYNGSQAGLRDQRFWNNSTDVLDRWTESNRDGSIPRVVFGDNISNGSAFAISENIQKGDFLRLRNIALGYSINRDLLSKISVSSLRIYGQIQNGFVITNYTGSDPEISSNGTSNFGAGVDRNSAGQSRIYSLGINLGF